jgi:anti-sigma factor RsiW
VPGLSNVSLIVLERRNSVNCKEVIELVDAYLDGELDPVTNREIEGHLQNCSASDQLFKEHHAVVGAIGAVAPYHKAPAGLRERVQASLREQIPGSVPGAAPELGSDVTRKQPDVRTLLFELPWNWLGLAAALAVAVLLVWNLAPGLRRLDAEPFLATQLVASHVRSLMVDHLTDVTSSDQHTVKPWFDGKLDFAPTVVNPASDGFPLVGGRLDYLNNRPVAALVYQRRKHFINVSIWPVETGDATATKAISRQGYQLLHWVDHDLNYWAVSDASGEELVALKELIEKQTAPQP